MPISHQVKESKKGGHILSLLQPLFISYIFSAKTHATQPQNLPSCIYAYLSIGGYFKLKKTYFPTTMECYSSSFNLLIPHQPWKNCGLLRFSSSLNRKTAASDFLVSIMLFSIHINIKRLKNHSRIYVFFNWFSTYIFLKTSKTHKNRTNQNMG